MEQLLENILPEEIYLHFEFVSLKENPDGFEMRLNERSDLFPSEMEGLSDVVLDGFCNPLELLHFSVKGKPLYLKLYRRRWKVSCGTKHYSNSYSLHPEGVKATHEFATFLKGEVGCTTDEYVSFLLNPQS